MCRSRTFFVNSTSTQTLSRLLRFTKSKQPYDNLFIITHGYFENNFNGKGNIATFIIYST